MNDIVNDDNNVVLERGNLYLLLGEVVVVGKWSSLNVFAQGLIDCQSSLANEVHTVRAHNFDLFILFYLDTFFGPVSP